MRSVSLVSASFLLLLGLAGCPVKETCADGFVASGSDCVPMDAGHVDAGPPDAGPDLGTDAGPPDAGPCGAPCEGTTPLCDATTGDCVACLVTDDCTATPTTPVCVEGACVACAADTDCTTLTAPECDTATHACVACTGNTACTARTGTTVCDTAGGGACVECTAGDETACGANSCNPATRTCTATPRASVRTCGACTADSECLADNRCVPMVFQGTARTGGYCLKRGAAGCVRPYTVPTATRVSLSGTAAEAYCGVDETVTTCEAVLALIDDTVCAVGTDTDCGAADLADGLCRTVSLVANRCSYACSAASQCPTSFTCTAGYCGS
jgi:hypothetical protein